MITDISQDDTVITVAKWITSKDGVEIYTKSWKAVSGIPVATIVFLHGFGEHINRYNHVFDKFAKANIEVYGYDRRGFGETAIKNKNPGICGGWKVAAVDMTEALIAQRKDGIPQFLMGHSMGGGLVLQYACEGPERDNIAGFICSSPLIQLATKSKILPGVAPVGSAISKIFPNITISVKLDANYLSRDPAEVKKYVDDPLVHGIGSLVGLGDMLMGSKSIMNKKCCNITSPIYIAHGSADYINCPNASEKLAQKIPPGRKTFRMWEGRYHEMHNDYDNACVIDDYIQWILNLINPDNSNVQDLE